MPDTLQTKNSAIAEPSIDQINTGDYSIHLETTGSVGSGDEGRIHLKLPAGTTLGLIDTISWMEYLVKGYAPHVDIIIDTDGDGVRDDAIVFEYSYNWATGFHLDEAWPTYGSETGAWYKTFSDDGDGPAQVDDAAFGWLSSGPPGPYGDSNFIAGTLADWKAGLVSALVDMDTAVLAIEIEIDNWISQTEAYIDDIEINGKLINTDIIGFEWTKYDGPISFDEECKHVLYYWAKDNVCNKSDIQKHTYYVDGTPPKVDIHYPEHGYYVPGNNSSKGGIPDNEPREITASLGKLDEMKGYTSQNSGDVIWDNVMLYDNAISSQDGSPNALISIMADDFILTDPDTIVTDVHWIGSQESTTENFDFEIIFYEDQGDGNAPGTVYAGPFFFSNAQVHQTYIEEAWGKPVYSFMVDLPTSVSFSSGTKYWISIQAIGDRDVFGQYFWASHTDPITLHQAKLKSAYFGAPDWTDIDQFTDANDMCFQLTGGGGEPVTQYLKKCAKITLTAEDVGTEPCISGLEDIFWRYEYQGISHPTIEEANNANVRDISIYYTAEEIRDDFAGIKYWYVYNDDEGIHFMEECEHILFYWAKDNVCNHSKVYKEVYLVDATPPKLDISHPTHGYYEVANADNTGYLKLGAAKITLTAEDVGTDPCISGLEDIFWRYEYDDGNGLMSYPFETGDNVVDISRYYDETEIQRDFAGIYLWYKYTDDISFFEECEHILYYWAKDNVCNHTEVRKEVYYVDGTPPELEKIHPDPGYHFDEQTNMEYLAICAKITLRAWDVGTKPCISGLEGIYWRYEFDGVIYPTDEEASASNVVDITIYYSEDYINENFGGIRYWYIYDPEIGIHFYEECEHILYYWAKDNVCNHTEVHSQTYYVDGTPPATWKEHYGPIFTHDYELVVEDAVMTPTGALYTDEDLWIPQVFDTGFQTGANANVLWHDQEIVGVATGDLTGPVTFYHHSIIPLAGANAGIGFARGEWKLGDATDYLKGYYVADMKLINPGTADSHGRLYATEGGGIYAGKYFEGEFKGVSDNTTGLFDITELVFHYVTWVTTFDSEIVIFGTDLYGPCSVGSWRVHWEVYDANGELMGNYGGTGEWYEPLVVVFEEECYHKLVWWLEDNVGNMSAKYTQIYRVDSTAPETLKTVGDPKYGTDDFWVTTGTPITLTATDYRDPCAVGVDYIHYEIWLDSNGDDQLDKQLVSKEIYDGDPDDKNTAFGIVEIEFNFTEECLHEIRWYAVDYLGNAETERTQQHRVDDTPPVTEKIIGYPKYGTDDYWVTTKTDITIIAKDEKNPCAVGVEYMQVEVHNGISYIYQIVDNHGLDDNPTPGVIEFTFNILEECKHTILWWTEDYLGNGSEIQQEHRVDDTPPLIRKTHETHGYVEHEQIAIDPAFPIPWQTWEPIPGGIRDILQFPEGADPETEILVQRWYAVTDEPLLLEELVRGGNRYEELIWVQVDEKRERLTPQTPLLIDIPVDTTVDSAVLVRISLGNFTVDSFFDITYQIEFEGDESDPVNNPPILIGSMANFDVHQFHQDKGEMDNFELEMYGIEPSDILGWYWDGRIPNPTSVSRLWGTTWYGGWGASPTINPIEKDNAVVGTKLKWIDTNYPIPFCEWVHFGVRLDPTASPTGAMGYWTQITGYPYLKACSPIKLEATDPGECAVGVKDIYWSFRYEGQYYPYRDDNNVIIKGPSSDYDNFDLAANVNRAGELWFVYDTASKIHFYEACKHELFYWAEDELGNKTHIYRQEYYVDDEGPETELTLPDEGYYAINDSTGYLTVRESIYLTATDLPEGKCASGIEAIFWRWEHNGISYPGFDFEDPDDIIISGQELADLYGYDDLIGTLWFFATYGAEISLNKECKHVLYYWSKDNVCNREPVINVHTFFVDGTPPETVKTYDEPLYTDSSGTNWITKDTEIKLTATDYPENECASGVAMTYYKVYKDGETPPSDWEEYTGPFTIPEDCLHVIEYYSVDNVGNEETVKSQRVRVDNQPPTADKEVGETKYSGPNDPDDFWITTGTDITITATDLGEPCAVGVQKLVIVVWWDKDNDGTFGSTGDTSTSYTIIDQDTNDLDTTTIGVIKFTFNITEECYHQIIWWAMDYLGNSSEPIYQKHKVDDTPPTTTDDSDDLEHEEDVTVTLTPVDGGEICPSGVKTTWYRVTFGGTNGDWKEGTSVLIETLDGENNGVHTIEYYSIDNLGNKEAIKKCTVIINVVPKDLEQGEHYTPSEQSPEETFTERTRVENQLAQSFTPQAKFNLRQVRLYLSSTFNGYPKLTVEIQSNKKDERGGDIPSGTVLASVEKTFFGPFGAKWVDININVPELTKDTKYWIVIYDNDSESESEYFSWYKKDRWDGEGSYDRGDEAYRRNVSDPWTSISYRDRYFDTKGYFL